MNESERVLIGQETKGFDYFIKEVKQTIFDVLFVLLKEEDQEDGLLMLYSQTAIDYIQMHTFPFNDKINFIWKATSFLQIIFTIFGVFDIQNYLPRINYLTYVISVYILLFVILLIIIDILFVSYQFSKKRFAIMWPLYVLRSVASLIVTVFFLPITETLISVIECQTDPATGKLQLDLFPEIECWAGWHLLHSLLASFFNLIFIIICAIVAYAFFEPRMNSNDKTARQDSTGEVAFIINKVSCQVLFSFLGADESWILIIVTFVLSVWLFIVYNFDDPYYNYEVGMFYNVITTYYLWTNFMLLVSKILETTSFNGGLIAWILGLPFIVMIMLSTKKSRIDTLVRSQNKFRSGEQIQGHLRYVLQLIQNQKRDKNAYMLLIGYIEKHKETCQEEDCPLKQKKQTKKRKRQETEMDEQIRFLLQELDRMYINGLKKFPNCTILRLSYAFFLYERMQNRNKAYEQLKLAQKGKPAFDEQFIIYRYQKIIKENLDGETENSDIVSIIAFDNHISLCEEYMKISANLHKEFWAELKEEQPDLDKLNIVGANIQKAVNIAKENYWKMQRINSSVPQTIKVFGNFLLNVLNDKTKGLELIKQAKMVKDSFRQDILEKKDEINFEGSPIPYIQVSAKKSDLGSIIQINQHFTTLFGYSKEEIVGKKINLLMPKVYASVHDKYIQKFIENILMNIRADGQIESDYLQIEQERYFKLKNGYIFPCIYKVILNIEMFNLITTFKSEPTLKTYVHFIVKQDTVIMDLSTSAITFFNLELKVIQAKEVRLNSYITDILDKNNKEIQHQINEMIYYFKVSIQEIRPNRQFKEDSDEEKQENEQTLYYIIKLEKVEKLEGKVTNSRSQPLSQDEPKGNSSGMGLVNGQFENSDFDPQIAAFMQDLYSVPKEDDYKEIMKNLNVECESLSHVDFSDTILTRRLINNIITQIDEEREEEFLKLLEEEEEEFSMFRNKGENFEDEDDYKLFTHSNSTVLIKKALNAHHSHQQITKFKLYSTLWIFTIILLTITQYLFGLQYFDQYLNDVNVLHIVNKKLVDLNKLTSRVLDITYDSNLEYIQQDINVTSSEIIKLNKDFNSLEYSQFFENYQTEVSFRFYKQNLSYIENNISLESSFLILNSLALNASYQLQDNQQNSQIQSFVFNFFNRIDTKINQISQNLIVLVTNHMNSVEIELIILLIVLFFVTSISMVYFMFLMFTIKMQRENILFLFLDIPQDHVEKLYKKCERFVKTYVPMRDLMTKNEMEGYESSDEEFEENNNIVQQEKNEDEEELLLKQSQNRKKIIQKYQQNKFKGSKNIILQFIVIAMFSLFFTIFNLITGFGERIKINKILPQYYQNNYLVSKYAYYLNIQKMMMIDYEYEILDNDVVSLVEKNLRFFQDNAQQLREFNLYLLDQDSSFLNLYYNIYFGNTCKVLEEQLNKEQQEQCSSIIKSNLKIGVMTVEQFYLEYFSDNLVQFKLNKEKKSDLLNKSLLKEIDISIYEYVAIVVDKLIQFEEDMINSDIDATKNIQLSLLIIFILLLLGFFLVFWIPFLSNLNSQINNTIEMLNMIPINVIKENKSIRRFVKSLIKLMDMQDSS